MGDPRRRRQKDVGGHASPLRDQLAKVNVKWVDDFLEAHKRDRLRVDEANHRHKRTLPGNSGINTHSQSTSDNLARQGYKVFWSGLQATLFSLFGLGSNMHMIVAIRDDHNSVKLRTRYGVR